MTDDALHDIIAGGKLCVIATIRKDGRPQLSQVTYAYDRGRDMVRVSVTDSRAKTANLRRDPRGTLLVQGPGGWAYAAAEFRAEVLPVTTDPHDASADELVDIYRSVAGEHPDWEEFREAMVTERRLPLHLHLDKVLGMAGRH
ncbi:PPOX class F420-dependent oxidoreductase [Ornithinimicrobium avium]|uniref:PPOX class F420-dependent oxidoreductase n=1 Tax=Ornithinimicrobium avium TaxID=2283195 RepID=A0A345NL27_9MICO|nr:PPOX class F420-dependent oxidoreductase [Ornithinimicrobium avium]AXH95735.1 PPOX class F420-dependent oxidoreductase [Ornithinimicrobium avium]